MPAHHNRGREGYYRCGTSTTQPTTPTARSWPFGLMWISCAHASIWLPENTEAVGALRRQIWLRI